MNLPPKVSLSARRIWCQGKEVNCCLSCALASCFEALDEGCPELAPLFHYWWARADRSTAEPLTPHEGFLAAQLKGFCKLPLHNKEFSLEGARAKPSEAANTDAASRALGAEPIFGQPLCCWLPRSDATRSWKKALALKYPILLGIYLDSSYWAMKDGTVDTWEDPGPGSPNSGHAVAVLGYDDDKGHFIAQDSRGSSFAKDGRWFIPYGVTSSNSIYGAYAIGASPLTGLSQ